MMPRDGVVQTWVVEDSSGCLTDMISYYHLPSTIIGNEKHSTLRAAYAFYNVAGAHSIKDLMQSALVLAKNEGMDVFNALDLMDNNEFLEDLRFGEGDGTLQYYLYNWQCPEMPAPKVGLVML